MVGVDDVQMIFTSVVFEQQQQQQQQELQELQQQQQQWCKLH